MKHDVQRTRRLGVDPSQYIWLPEKQPHASQQTDHVSNLDAAEQLNQGDISYTLESTNTDVESESEKPDKGPSKAPIIFGSLMMILGLVAGFVIYTSIKEDTFMLVSIIAMNIVICSLFLPGNWKLWSLLPGLVVGIISLTGANDFWSVWLMFFALGSPVPTFTLGLKMTIKRALKRRWWRRSGAGTKDHGAKREPAPKHEFIYGSVGGVAGATGVFSEAAISAGVLGEQSTAYLLETFLKDIPDVTIFHGLKFPGSQNADVDHAVIRGDTIYLIDSKQYKTGTYDWKTTQEHGERISGADGHGYKNYMGSATEGYRNLLGHQVEVVSLLIIHGKNIKVGSRIWSSQGVGVFNAHDGLNFIGNHLSMAGSVINTRAKNVLIGQLKG